MMRNTDWRQMAAVLAAVTVLLTVSTVYMPLKPPSPFYAGIVCHYSERGKTCVVFGHMCDKTRPCRGDDYTPSLIDLALQQKN
jgi:hypothetical protein